MGQVDSTMNLSTVQVVQYRSQVLSVGLKTKTIDTAITNIFKGQSLSELLSNYGPVYVKSNGPGNLATTAFRGGSSSHTALVWNGFNINNSMNGLVDLSLIPVGLNDEISVQYGASTSLWGSGALGGAILLNNSPKFNTGWSASVGLQSTHFEGLTVFNGYSRNLSLSYGSRDLYISLKSFGQSSDNDYPYAQEFIEESSTGIRRNLHAWNRSEGMLADLSWKISNKHLLSLHYWFQDAYREIPRTLNASLNAYNYPFLKDQTHRTSINYSWIENEWILNVRSAYFHKDLLYYDSFNEDAKSISSNFINEIDWIYKPDNKWIVNIGLNQNFSTGQNANYANTLSLNSKALVERNRNSLSVFSSIKRKVLDQKGAVALNLRQEVLDGEVVPFTFSLGWDYTLSKNLSMLINASRVYRIPNLNDLYWNPGGNPDLRAEDGWALEGSLIGHGTIKSTLLNVEFTGFYRQVENWIQWVPGSVWSPENLLQVESYGVELNPSVRKKLGKWQINLKLPFQYTLSRNIKAVAGSENTHFKQLIYTPIYSANAWLQLAFKNWQLSYNHTYTGYTYTTTDHSEFINPYDVANVRIAYTKRIKRNRWNVWFAANNLLGEVYQVVRDRPMPLTKYQIGIQLTFNQNHLKK